MVPVEGPLREGVGLLGSPSFEIPRTVLRDSRLDHSGARMSCRAGSPPRTGTTRHDRDVPGGRWIHAFGLSRSAAPRWSSTASVGAPAFAVAGVLALVRSVLYFVLVERAVAGFRALEPQYCSIYEPYFWWHERYWKLSTPPKVLDGTPFKSLTWRLMGVRIGKRVFDDGAAITRRPWSPSVTTAH